METISIFYLAIQNNPNGQWRKFYVISKKPIRYKKFALSLFNLNSSAFLLLQHTKENEQAIREKLPELTIRYIGTEGAPYYFMDVKE